MRIAIILTGHMRDYDQYISLFNKFITLDNTVDIFIDTWQKKYFNSNEIIDKK